MLEIKQYVRKPFHVEGVEVTEENMHEVAQWCGGDVQPTAQEPATRFVKVRVNGRPTERQTKAFAGDWVLKAQGGFKVYTPGAFEKSFDQDANVPMQPDEPLPFFEQKAEVDAVVEEANATEESAHTNVFEDSDGPVDVVLTMPPPDTTPRDAGLDG